LEETLVDLLGLPDVPHVVYRQSPLALALCQVKFTRVLGVAQAAFVAPFQQAIQDAYPIAEPAQEVNLQFGFGPGGAKVQQEQRDSRWEFSDPAGTWKLGLAGDFLALETRKYETFGDFLDRLRQALEALSQHVRPALVTRVGLRYINEIRSESRIWSELLSPELLGPMSVPQFAAAANQSTQELLLRYDQGYGIGIRHGLFQRGTTVLPPTGQAETPEYASPFYLLDLDAYRQYSLPPGAPLSVESICQTVETFNRAIYRLFRWAVTDDFVNGLGVLRYASD